VGTLMLMQGDGVRRAEDLVTTHAIPALELARSVCVGDMFNNVLSAELNRSIGLTSQFRDAKVRRRYWPRAERK